MLLQARALEVIGAYERSQFRYSPLCADGVKLMNASSRMMDMTQKAALALHRLRTAGSQTMVVQHVNVSDGGQAVVTGKLRTAGKKKGEARGS